MADTNINIIFSNQEEAGSEANPATPASTPELNNPTQPKEKDEKGFTAKAVTLYSVKQGVNMATSRVGQIFRDTSAQDKMNAVVTLGAYAGMIATNPVMGSLGVVFDLANSMLDRAFTEKQESNQLSIISRKYSTINRSRQ